MRQAQAAGLAAASFLPIDRLTEQIRGETEMTLRWARLVGLSLVLLLAALPLRAADVGTADEAKALAEKAAALVVSEGPEKAFAQFNDKAVATFHDRDLYVFVLDAQGVVAAQGNNTSLIGKSVINLRDVDGKAFIQEFISVKQPGWIEYKWLNPQTRAVDAKASYVIPVQGYYLGVGVYRK